MDSNGSSNNKAYIIENYQQKYYTPFPIVSEPRKILFTDHFVNNSVQDE